MNIRFKDQDSFSGIDGAGSSENSGSDERKESVWITVLLCAEVEIMVEMDSPLQDFFIWRKRCVCGFAGKKHP